MKYQVIVGNIGTAHDGNNFRTALSLYHAYVRDSKKGIGRGAGEEVTLMDDGEPVREHRPLGYGDHWHILQGAGRDITKMTRELCLNGLPVDTGQEVMREVIKIARKALKEAK